MQDEAERIAGALNMTRREAAQVGGFAWESTTPVFFKYISDSYYHKLRPGFQKWYKPYRCSACLRSNT